jgi:ABC-type Fe3+ transport system permease subunit
MKSLKFPLTILLLSQVAVVSVLALTAHRLPERLASHFNLAGDPDGWMSRSSHLWMMGLLAFGLSLLVVGLFYGLRFLPVSMINLPQREYWLAPERQRQTLHDLFRTGIWLACLEALFILGIHLLMVSANAQQPARMPFAICGAFIVGVLLWVGGLLRRFRTLPE